MGVQRTFRELAKITGIEFDVLKEWSEAYAWDEQITELDRDVSRQYEAYYEQKTRDIRNRLVSQMENLLSDMESCSLGLPFAVTSPGDLKAIAQAYEALTRANVLALTKGQGVSSDKTPKTWSDLLSQSNIEQAEQQEEI